MKVNVLDQIRSVMCKKLKFPNFICIIRISDISVVIDCQFAWKLKHLSFHSKLGLTRGRKTKFQKSNSTTEITFN